MFIEIGPNHSINLNVVQEYKYKPAYSKERHTTMRTGKLEVVNDEHPSTLSIVYTADGKNMQKSFKGEIADSIHAILEANKAG